MYQKISSLVRGQWQSHVKSVHAVMESILRTERIRVRTGRQTVEDPALNRRP